MNVEIANRLVQLRKQNNLSQEELAMRLGISRQAVSKWERAESSPDTDNLIALAGLYRMSLDELVRSDLPPDPTAYTPPYRPEPAEEPALETPRAPTLDGGWVEATVGPETPVPEDPAPEAPMPQADPLPEGSYFDSKEKRPQREEWLSQVPYPLFISALYLVLGVVFNLWHPGWLLFLTIPIRYMPEKMKRFPGCLGNPVLVVLIYLVLGFYLNLWHPGWLLFLAIPIFNSIKQ